MRLLVDRSAFHHEINIVQFSNVFQGVSHDRNDVGMLARRDRADDIGHLHMF